MKRTFSNIDTDGRHGAAGAGVGYVMCDRIVDVHRLRAERFSLVQFGDVNVAVFFEEPSAWTYRKKELLGCVPAWIYAAVFVTKINFLADGCVVLNACSESGRDLYLLAMAAVYAPLVSGEFGGTPEQCIVEMGGRRLLVRLEYDDEGETSGEVEDVGDGAGDKPEPNC